MKDYKEKIINIMDNAKDNIRTHLDRAYKSGYEDAKSTLVQKAYRDGYADAKSELGKNVIDLAHKENDRAYQQGLDDAWEAAKKIVHEEGLSIQELAQIFGTGSYSIVLEENTASEAIAKIKEYEEQQRQDTEIKVGDEVVIDDSIGIVTRAFPGAVTCYVMRKNGSSGEEDRNDCKTTGRHFDQIAEVLAEMRGDKE